MYIYKGRYGSCTSIREGMGQYICKGRYGSCTSISEGMGHVHL